MCIISCSTAQTIERKENYQQTFEFHLCQGCQNMPISATFTVRCMLIIKWRGTVPTSTWEGLSNIGGGCNIAHERQLRAQQRDTSQDNLFKYQYQKNVVTNYIF